LRIVLVTKNRGKLREIKECLRGLDAELLSLEDFPEITLPPEGGRSFTENAKLKARFVSLKTGLAAIADDSGLSVGFLGGRPGVLSARYAGKNTSDRENREKLLKELKGVPMEKRKARFRCVIAFCEPSGKVHTFTGEAAGLITERPKGAAGFGYDPVFFVPSIAKTFAELRPAEKNRISHRGRALKKFRDYLLRG
jgi:XTP/dITP diphosphohydrolase